MTDEQGRPAVGIELDRQGTVLFQTLTQNNIDRTLAILLDAEVASVPRILGATRKLVLLYRNKPSAFPL